MEGGFAPPSEGNSLHLMKNAPVEQSTAQEPGIGGPLSCGLDHGSLPVSWVQGCSGSPDSWARAVPQPLWARCSPTRPPLLAGPVSLGLPPIPSLLPLPREPLTIFGGKTHQRGNPSLRNPGLHPVFLSPLLLLPYPAKLLGEAEEAHCGLCLGQRGPSRFFAPSSLQIPWSQGLS